MSSNKNVQGLRCQLWRSKFDYNFRPERLSPNRIDRGHFFLFQKCLQVKLLLYLKDLTTLN